MLSIAATAAALPAAVLAQEGRAGEFSGHYTFGRQTSRFELCPDSGASINQGRTAAWVEFDSAAVHQLRGGPPAWPKPRPGDFAPTYFVRWRGRLSGEGSFGHLGASPHELVVTEILEVRAPAPDDCAPRPPAPPPAAARPPVVAAPAAKPAPARPKRWKTEIDVSGNLLFGNTTQSIVTTRNALSWTDSTLSLKSDLRFTYGQSSTQQRGSQVSRRTWLFTLSGDMWPYARQSAFLTGSFESSFERRIQSRTNAGVGHKVVLVRTPSSRLDVSLAILGERSALRDAQGRVTDNDLARWSARVRGDRKLSSRVSVTHETFYRPEYDALGRFTFTSSSSVGYQITRFAQLKASFLDNYDTGARGRGARTNNDGQVVVGALTVF